MQKSSVSSVCVETIPARNGSAIFLSLRTAHAQVFTVVSSVCVDTPLERKAYKLVSPGGQTYFFGEPRCARESVTIVEPGRGRSGGRMGVVRLRLARFGRKNMPFYRITAADSRCPRDGRHLEILGHYNPLPGKDGHKRIGIHTERIKYWLSVGAQPSDTVARLLFLVGILPKPPMSHVARKGPPADRPTPPAADA